MPIRSGVDLKKRSNYLAGGLVFTAAYVDNLMLVGNASRSSDETYSLLPTIGLDRKTPRQSESLSYSAGFTILSEYERSEWSDPERLRLVTDFISPSMRYLFLGLVSTELQPVQPGQSVRRGRSLRIAGSSTGALIAPFAKPASELERARALSTSTSRTAMIGGSGSYSFLQFLERFDDQGLNNEDTAGADRVLQPQVWPDHYAGVTYQFSKFVTHPVDTYTVTTPCSGFTRTISRRAFPSPFLVVRSTTRPGRRRLRSQSAWTPAVQGSLGWQNAQTNLTASYSHIVSGAGGLVGTYHSILVDFEWAV